MWSSLRKKIWQWRGIVTTATAVAGSVIAVNSTGLFQLVEWATLDQFFLLRPQEPIDQKIVIIAINEADINQVGDWPISDAVLAQVLTKLKAQQPRVIGLDLYRNLPEPPGHQELVELFKSTPNLIGVEKAIEPKIESPPILQKLDQVAVADLILDADGKVRRGLVSSETNQDQIQLSLGASLALIYLEAEGITPKTIDESKGKLQLGQAIFTAFQENDGGYVNADAGGYQILLNYRGVQDKFLTFSLTDVLENRLPEDSLRERIVLIGSTAHSLNDLFRIPYSSSLFNSPQLSPGVVIHANLASQIVSAAKEGRPLIKTRRRLLEWLRVVCWSFGGGAGTWLLLQTKTFKQDPSLKWKALTLGVVLAGSMNLAGSYLAFLEGWWLPVVSPFLALTGSALAIAIQHSLDLQRANADLEILLETSATHADELQNELRHQALEAVWESERRLAQFLEAVPVGIVVIDTRGKPYFINQKARQLHGREEGDSSQPQSNAEFGQFYLAGTNLPYPSDNLPSQRALRGESFSVDDIEIHTGNKIIPIEAWGTPIYNESGKVAYSIVAFQDITERKRAALERKNFTNQILQINLAYERFVPKEFLQLLDKKTILDVQLGDQVQKNMSILFSDIRSFTTFSEKMTPSENFQFINTYLSCMEPAIVANHGFIDKYIGDGLMALFSGIADDAVRAGIAMLTNLAEYNHSRQMLQLEPIKIGIGINTGSLMLGTVGGKSRMDGTVISDAVNLASRLEDLTKKYGVSLLISHHTFACLQNPTDYLLRFIDQITVKGKSKPVAVFEVFDGDEQKLKDGKLATKGIFEEALFLFHQCRFWQATQLLKDCLRINPKDKVAQIYLERCQKNLIPIH
ncbi:MAG: CHASE2 domain-containing protein [Coleofasciculaceae cyanobacterium]